MFERTNHKLGRNDPCWCNSGRKYKKCCQPYDQGDSRPIESELHQYILLTGSGIYADELLVGNLAATIAACRDDIDYVHLRLTNFDDFVVLAKDAVYILASCLNPFEVSAIYPPLPHNPYPRRYYFQKEKVGMDTSLEECVIMGKILSYLKKFSNWVEQSEVERITANYIETLPDRLDELKKTDYFSQLKLHSQLASGRQEKGIIDRAFFFSGDRCLTCNSALEEIQNIAHIELGWMCSFPICNDCIRQADELNMNSFEFLLSKQGLSLPLPSTSLTQEDMIELTKKELPNLINVVLSKHEKERNTLMFEANDGIKLILRLDGPLDYAYIFLDSNGNQQFLFDPDHEHQLIIGPHHEHDYVLGKKQIPTESYLTGCPLLDAKAIESTIKYVQNKIKGKRSDL